MNHIKSELHFELASIATFFQNEKYDKIAVLTDENTSKYCLPLIQNLIPSFIEIKIDSGESYKNIQTCQLIWNKLLAHEFSRKSLLINLGGGVINDMGSFAASIYKRGIDCMNIPTTLLSMVDASIGGKTGIDYLHYKNVIGSFYKAKSTIIDSTFITTLAKKQIVSGYAEMLKHGLIADFNYFNELSNLALFEIKNWNLLIKKSIEIKSTIVLKNPKEKGLRKILNFGHTIGHALESYFLQNSIDLLHGEAIIYGMIAALYLSNLKFNYSNKFIQQLELFASHYLGNSKLKFNKLEIIQLLKQDKKKL